MKNPSLNFIKDNIGNYAYISTKETSKFGAFYDGVLKELSDSSLVLDNEICIDFKDIKTIYFDFIN